MRSRMALVIVAMLVVLGQLALPAFASGHDFDPAHADHDCVMCTVIHVDEGDPDGLSPDDVSTIVKSEGDRCLLAVAIVHADLTPSSYNPRGPPLGFS
ncbi:MAG: hypothetical protein AAF950_02590 [Pseudomonadota bacterium]